MTDTTIPVSDDVKAQVDELKEDGETYNRLIQRLVNHYDPETEAWTEEDIRSMARQEAKDMIREYGGGNY